MEGCLRLSRSLEELIYNYDTSGMLTMIAQEFIGSGSISVRWVSAIGQKDILPMKYDLRANGDTWSNTTIFHLRSATGS